MGEARLPRALVFAEVVYPGFLLQDSGEDPVSLHHNDVNIEKLSLLIPELPRSPLCSQKKGTSRLWYMSFLERTCQKARKTTIPLLSALRKACFLLCAAAGFSPRPCIWLALILAWPPPSLSDKGKSCRGLVVLLY